MVLIREGGEVGPAETFDVGTMASIVDFHQLSDGLLGLSCVGRAAISHSQPQPPNGWAQSCRSRHGCRPSRTCRVPARHARLSALLKNVLPQLGEVYTDMEMKLDDAAWVGHRLAEILPIPPADKQSCLELDDPIQRLDFLSPLA